MLDAHPPTASRVVVTAALGGALVASASAAGIHGLGDTDPYRHLAYAHALWSSGFTLRGHPFLPFTLLGQSGVDLWWLLHLVLVPFSFLGVVWGGRLAGVCFAAFFTGGCADAFRRLGVPAPHWLALTSLALSPQFTFRDHLARPSHLTVPLMLWCFAAGLGRVRPLAAGAAALVHGLLHLSSPLSPLFAMVGSLAARREDRARGVRGLVASGVGLAAALILRPDRFDYLNVALQTNLGALGLSGAGMIPHTAFELLPESPGRLFTETWPGWLALVAAAGAGWRRSAVGRQTRLGVGALLALSVLAALRSGRFIDYVVPLQSLAIGVHLPAEASWARRRAMLALAAAPALVLIALHVKNAWEVGNRYIDPPVVFERLAAQVRAQVPAGTLLFVDDPFLTGVVYAALPEYRYVVAYDPSLLYFADTPRFWVWHHAVVEGIACDRPACPDAVPSGEAIARAVAAFGTTWAVTSYPPGVPSMQTVLEQSPLWQETARIPGPVTGLHLWSLKR